jgi:tetratricopeptide (TPR) repeat protein
VRARARQAVALAVVAAVAVGVHWGALSNGFVWDDTLVLGKQLGAFRTPLAAFLPPDGIQQFSRSYYRPVVTLTYLLDRAVGGGAARAFHATPIAVHALACVVLLLLLWRLLGPRARVASTVAALAFAVHPVHVEVVAWMAGRAEALAAVGVLAALAVWLRWVDGGSPWTLVAGAAALLLGLLGKETAAVGVPLAAALPWLRPAIRRRPPWPLFAAVGAAVVAYVVLRRLALGSAVGLVSPPPVDHGVAGVLAAVGFYAAGLVWPRSAGIVLTTVPSPAPMVALGAAALVAGVGVLAVAAVRRARALAWGVAWIGLALAPPLLLVVRGISETPIAERYLYLPSAGAAVCLAWALARLPRRAVVPVGVVGTVLLGVAAVATAARTGVWRDDLTFWRNAAAAAPEEGFPLLKLGVVLHRKGDLAAAEAAYHGALARRLSREQRAVTQNNLAHLLLRQRRVAEAEPLFREAVAPGPRFSGPYWGLAECLLAAPGVTADGARLAEARGLLERALAIEPGLARAALLLAQTLIAEGRRPEALHWLDHAARVAPGSDAAARAQQTAAALRAQ